MKRVFIMLAMSVFMLTGIVVAPTAQAAPVVSISALKAEALACPDGTWCGGGSAYKSIDYRTALGALLFTVKVDVQVQRQGSYTWLRPWAQVVKRHADVTAVQAGSSSTADRMRMGPSGGGAAVRTCPVANHASTATTWGTAYSVNEVPEPFGTAYRTVGEASARIINGTLYTYHITGNWTTYTFIN